MPSALMILCFQNLVSSGDVKVGGLVLTIMNNVSLSYNIYYIYIYISVILSEGVSHY